MKKRSSESGGVLVEGLFAFAMCLSFATYVAFSPYYDLLTSDVPITEQQALSFVRSPVAPVSHTTFNPAMSVDFGAPNFIPNDVQTEIDADLTRMGYEGGDICHHTAIYRRTQPDCSGSLVQINFTGDATCAASATWPGACETLVQNDYANIAGCSFYVFCRFKTGAAPGGPGHVIFPGAVPSF